MNKALKISEGNFINMDHISKWEVSQTNILIFMGAQSIQIAVNDQINEQELGRIHKDLSEYMGAPLDCMIKEDTNTQTHSNTDNSDGSLMVTQMDENWTPNSEVDAFLLENKIPAHVWQKQLLEFKQHYIENGRTAMFWDARFINWMQRALEKDLG